MARLLLSIMRTAQTLCSMYWKQLGITALVGFGVCSVAVAIVTGVNALKWAKWPLNMPTYVLLLTTIHVPKNLCKLSTILLPVCHMAPIINGTQAEQMRCDMQCKMQVHKTS